MYFSALKIPIMDSNTDTLSLEESKFSLSLLAKEYFFLFLVMFMGLSGLSLCIKKLYPDAGDDYEDIIAHDIEFVHAGILQSE